MDETTRLSRKELEKEARMKDIIDVAAQLFSSREYHEVKVDEIAERVGLSKGTIYLYFENKEKLFYSIIFERTKMLVIRLTDSIRDTSVFDDSLRAFVATYLSFFTENATFFKLMQSIKSLVDWDNHMKLHEQAGQAYRVAFTLIIDLMERGSRQGRLRDISVDDAAKMLWGMLHAFTFHRIMIAQEKSMDDDEANRIVDLFLRGVER